MKKFNKEKLVSGIGLAMAGMTALAPLQTMAISTQASVKVKNAITFAETAPLSFGTVRANFNTAIVQGNLAGDAALLVLPPDDTATMTATNGNNNVSMNSLVRGSSAKYTITGAAPFTDINILVTNSAAGAGGNVDLTTANAAAPGFIIRGASWVGRDLTLNTNFDIGDANGLGKIGTDGTGAASFSLGATLATESTTVKTVNYDANNEVEYTGQFSVTVSY